MSWFNTTSQKKPSEAALRDRALAIHGPIVDRALNITQENALGLADDFFTRFDVMVFLVSAVLHHLHHRSQKPLPQKKTEHVNLAA